KQLLEYIEKGETETDKKNAQPAVSVKELEKKAEQEEISFDGISYVKVDGNIADVGLSFKNAKNKDSSFIAEVRMRWMNGYWQALDVKNGMKIVKKLGMYKALLTESRPSPPGTLQHPQGGQAPEPALNDTLPRLDDPLTGNQPSSNAISPTLQER